MDTYWIDSHSHLNEECFRPEFDRYMENASKANVGRIMLICGNFSTLGWTLPQLKRYPQLDCACGFHPEDASKISESDWQQLEKQLTDPRIKAIGEIGLDYYWSKEEMDLQKAIFIRQLQLANQVSKPVLIHSRQASKDTYDLLSAYAKVPVVMHCYSGSTEMMENYLRLGCYISFAGPVTFKKAQEPKRNATLVPADRLLIETDCPYMAPEPMRGKQNESSYVAYTGAYVAQLRGVKEAQLQRQIQENYQRLLGEDHGQN